MKKIKIGIFSILAVLFMTNNVNAEETIQNLTQLEECLGSGEVVCTIGANIEADDTILVGGSDVTLDLNGYTISLDVDTYENAIILVQHGTKLTIKDSSSAKIGKLSYITELTTNKVRTAIKLTKSKGDNSKVAELVVEGGTIEGDSYAISGNGLAGRSNTKTTINGGKFYSKATAIFQPQAGELIINGGTIEGKTGIEIRAGKLEVNGGTIIGTAKPLESEKNSNGTTTVGAGLAIVQHTTTLAIDTVINGGVFKGYTALHQESKEDNSNSEIVSLTVNGGTFTVINEGEKALYSEDKKAFITGGTFTTNVKDYVAADYVSKKVGDNYNVGKENNINITENENGVVTTDKITAVVGETVTITVTPNEGYKLGVVKVVDKNNKAVEVTENTFVMPNSAVTITTTYTETTTKVEIPVLDTEEEPEEVIVGVTEDVETESVLLESLDANTDLSEKIKNKNVNVSVEISSIDTDEISNETKTEIEKVAEKLTVAEYFDISVVVRDEEDSSEIDKISELTKEIELMILLPEKLKNSDKEINRKYYVIREHDGKATKMEAKLSEDGKYLTFKSKQFSTYALAYEDVAIEKVDSPQTGDNVLNYVMISLISLFAFVGSGLYLKKRFN